MSKTRIQLYAELDTYAHAVTVYNALSNELAGKNIFELHNLSVGSNSLIESGTANFVSVDGRFNSRTDRDSVNTWIKGQVNDHPTVKTWVTKASLTTHLCTHDDASVKNCRTTEYVVEIDR